MVNCTGKSSLKKKKNLSIFFNYSIAFYRTSDYINIRFFFRPKKDLIAFLCFLKQLPFVWLKYFYPWISDLIDEFFYLCHLTGEVLLQKLFYYYKNNHGGWYTVSVQYYLSYVGKRKPELKF